MSSLVICSGHMALFLFGLRGLVLRCSMRSTHLDTLQRTMTVLCVFAVVLFSMYLFLCLYWQFV